MFNVLRIALGALALGAVSMASAQVSVDYQDDVPAVPDGTTTATMDVNWINDTNVGNGGITSLQMEMTLPDGVTLTACNDGPAIGGSTHDGISNCDVGTSGAGTFTIAWFDSGNDLLPDGVIAQLDFTVADGTSFGSQPIGLTDLTDPSLNSMTDVTGAEITIDPGTNFNGEGGSLLVQCPDGESCYQSDPPIGSNIVFGDAVVGQATTPAQTIGVSNAQDDTVNSFTITGVSDTSTDVTIDSSTTFPQPVPANGGSTVINVDLACVPASRGDFSGTLTIENDATNPAGSEDYPFDCTGLSPNVAVSNATVEIRGSTADASAPTGSFDITNAQDGFAVDATNAALADQGNSAEISIQAGLTNNTISVDEVDPVTLECDNSAAGSSSETIRLTFDDPAAAGGTGTIDVTVNCEIVEESPGYTSDPAVPGPLAFGQVANGGSSTLTIDIGNEGSVGSGAGAELEITGAVLSDTTNYSFAPDPFTATLAAMAPNGTATLDVSCNPQSIGDFSGATLTVQTNDGDQVYDLSCEGISNAELVLSPAVMNGTFNIGSIQPNGTVSANLLFSNAGTDPITVTCDALTDNNGGVITADPDPINFTLPPDDGTVTFTGTPPEIETFTEVLANCEASGEGFETVAFDVTVSVTGRPLVVPTMSNWGLVVMSLMLLLVGGFATRRMLA